MTRLSLVMPPVDAIFCSRTNAGLAFRTFSANEEQVTVEELRGGMVVSGPQVQRTECMRLFAGGVIMAALGERGVHVKGEVENAHVFAT